MQLSFEAEKFIALIKPRDAIWNYRNHLYMDKELRRSEWISVCKEMVPNFDEKTPTAQHAIVTSFQKQWKILRDGFLRSLKNIKKRGSSAKPYTYHNDLLFMIELYDQDTDKEVIQKRDDSSEHSDAEAVPSPDEVPVVKRRPKHKNSKRRISTTKEVQPKAPSPTPEESLIEKITHYIGNEERTKQDTSNDEDKLFLLSLLGDLKSIPEALKLDAKFDIMNVLRHYRNIGGPSKSSKGPRSKRSRKSAAVSTTDNKTTEVCYVKCEDDASEEN